MSGYLDAMLYAGTEVHVFKSFGSYQGEWWAKVTYKGETGWVDGSYGSCSGCDAFYSEFDFRWHDCKNGEYQSPIYSLNFVEDCEECQEIKKRFIAFGEKYLSYIMTQEEAEKLTGRNLDWDMDALEMVNFIRENG